jgi:hypothetical protein
METIIKKPLNEYKLAQNTSHSKKGHKGFIRVKNPKDSVFQIRVSSDVKNFMDQYCQKFEITKTQLIMGAIECYTGFNGSNASKCLTIK